MLFENKIIGRLNMAKYCMFCDPRIIEEEIVCFNDTCIFLRSEKYNPKGVLEGAGVIITKRHVGNPFLITEKEWSDMFKLLKQAKKHIDELYNPDGFTIGFNVGAVSGQIVPHHVHLHLMPRYNDEPLAGKGIRHFYKQRNNSRRQSKPAIKLNHWYVFPGLQQDIYSGIWETIEVTSLNTDAETWKLMRVLSSDEKHPVRIEITLPKLVFEHYARVIEENILKGKSIKP
jgi:histidine triad (HIT) family protein